MTGRRIAGIEKIRSVKILARGYLIGERIRLKGQERAGHRQRGNWHPVPHPLLVPHPLFDVAWFHHLVIAVPLAPVGAALGAKGDHPDTQGPRLQLTSAPNKPVLASATAGIKGQRADPGKTAPQGICSRC